MDVAALRAAFPVFASLAYLNAGTDGPVPSAALEAVSRELEDELLTGRFKAHFERRGVLRDDLRSRYAGVLGAEAADVAITSCTSEGIARTLSGLTLRAGDLIVTSTDEHPGLLAPLGAARRRYGVEISTVPWEQLPDAVEERAVLVACSHVNWVDGRVVPAGLAERCAALEVPLLLDGAQGVGAVPTDVRALGCSIYAGSGQKWLCGPDGSGMLWIDPAFRDAVAMPDPSYLSLADAHDPLNSELQPDGRRYDGPGISREATAFAVAAHDVLDAVGFDAVHVRARAQAERLANELEERGHEVAPRDATTLVSWKDPDAEGTRDRLAEQSIVIRDLPGRGLLRASIGAWNDESDLERLLEALTPNA